MFPRRGRLGGLSRDEHISMDLYIVNQHHHGWHRRRHKCLTNGSLEKSRRFRYYPAGFEDWV